MIKNHSLKVGFSFGLTSGIITTLGLMVGVYTTTYSKLAVIGAVLTIAVADAFSDALGIHISEESETKHTAKEIWISTLATFCSKFIFASIFIVPIVLLNLKMAVISSIILGIFLLSFFSFFLAREQSISAWRVILEHDIIALVVVVTGYFLGEVIHRIF